MTHKRNIETLCSKEFKLFGLWKLKDNRGDSSVLLDYDIVGHLDNQQITHRNVLYAFGSKEEVYYIGKTTQSIKKRIIGYCNPGPTQQTNQRCNKYINEKIKNGEQVYIYLCCPPTTLQFSGLQINLAAGLEDAFIQYFSPIWNGGDKRKISETEEIEKIVSNTENGYHPQDNNMLTTKICGFQNTESKKTQLTTDQFAIRLGDDDFSLNDNEHEAIEKYFSQGERPNFLQQTGRFKINLGTASYDQGIVNPGIGVDSLFGDHEEKMIVYFSNRLVHLESQINRKAYKNGAVRFVGKNRQIAEWFQHHFKRDDIVEARILNPNAVLLIAPEGVDKY